MNLKNHKLIRTLARIARTSKKSIIVQRESRRRGGTSARFLSRATRLSGIKKEKEKIREDLIRSWCLGELGKPTPEEHDRFFLYYHYLPWSYLLEIKKKYWNL
jgi:hypothetical protein